MNRCILTLEELRADREKYRHLWEARLAVIAAVRENHASVDEGGKEMFVKLMNSSEGIVEIIEHDTICDIPMVYVRPLGTDRETKFFVDDLKELNDEWAQALVGVQ